jgi:photosystem II stability/assembly factor-like uncharacterized protein
LKAIRWPLSLYAACVTRTQILFPFVLVLLSGAALGQTLGQASGPWILEKSGTTAGLRGIHAVGGGVAWASGANGTVLRTEDGGYEWQTCAMPPGAEKLDFRGVWAWDDNTAIVMSSGTGDASRLYKTTDGCSSWKLLYTNPDKDGFWDAVQPLNDKIVQVLGDPVSGAFFIGGLKTDGTSPCLWRYAAADAQPGAGAFAASNSSLVVQGGRYTPDRAWFGTGGKPGAFVYRLDLRPVAGSRWAEGSPDQIEGYWKPVPVPVASGADAAGVFSLGFRDAEHAVAVGGDYTKPNETAGTAAWSADGGKTWTAAARPPHGFRSAVAWDADLKAWIAAGTNGSDISWDDGKTWQPLDGSETGGNWNALSLPWVVGPGGRVGKLDAGKVTRSGSR